ncbi:MAG: hypothetical protein M1327_04805 [Candidatus Thermoplasmatota archaeon]|nr:hypothetical protein [Candidatus Thermoplasmatota archaeon]
MNVLTDLEIIRSAVLSGEINDAWSRIKKRTGKYKFKFSLTHEEKYKVAADLLTQFGSILSGNAPVVSLTGMAGSIGKCGFSQFGEDAAMEYLSNMVYYLRIMLDRYNVRMPAFDAKRCGDL